MSTREDVVTGVTGAAAFGMMAAMGLGLSDTDGPEPWLAGALALALVLPGLTMRAETPRLAVPASVEASDSHAEWGRRAGRWGLIAVGFFIPHLALWLVLGLRLWPIGLIVAGASFACITFGGMVYARESAVPRWSSAPTVLLFLVQAAAAGLLALSAVEGLLGFPPSLVLWKAALAIVALALTAQLWQAKASESGEAGVPVRSDDLAARARARAKLLFRVAIVCGLALPFALAMVADAQTERLLLPVAFLLHMAGLAAHRLLFYAEARQVPGQ
jgi:DMSO reductase anchor subunit